MKKLKSLSIFFPFFNDGGTVHRQISDAFKYGKICAQQLEVIAIHGGRSIDNTWEKILSEKKKHPDLVILDKSNNREGYAVIKHGFRLAKNDWVFYTDGDAQYHLDDLVKLVTRQRDTSSDVVNGYKTDREDPWLRIAFGGLYRIICKLLFTLPIRDINCDFRLIRIKCLKKISLESRNATLLPELIKKLEYTGAKFSEVRVHHHPRIYGTSNFHLLPFMFEQLFGIVKLYLKLRSYRLSVSATGFEPVTSRL